MHIVSKGLCRKNKKKKATATIMSISLAGNRRHMERTIVPSPISKSLPCISECAHNTEKQYDPFQIPASNLKKTPLCQIILPVRSCWQFMFHVIILCGMLQYSIAAPVSLGCLKTPCEHWSNSLLMSGLRLVNILFFIQNDSNQRLLITFQT